MHNARCKIAQELELKNIKASAEFLLSDQYILNPSPQLCNHSRYTKTAFIITILIQIKGISHGLTDSYPKKALKL